MDANKLHRQIESPARTRIRASATNHGASSAPAHRDDGAIKAELHREELDYNGDGIVTLMEELDGANVVKKDIQENRDEFRNDNAPANDGKQGTIDPLPRAAILSMEEDRRRSFNPFSSHYASAPIPRQNRRVLVKEAKPVRDNANAIIMLLLVAILIVAVAIFSVVVAKDYQKAHNTSEQSPNTTKDESVKDKEDDEVEPIEHDFDPIAGRWEAVGNTGSCIVLDKEGLFLWLSDCGAQKGDSFSGNAAIYNGQEALDKLSISKERAARTAGIAVEKLDLSQTFAIIVKPKTFSVVGDEKVQKPSEIKLLVVETKDDEINVYNYQFAELGIYSRTEDGDEL